MMRKLVLVSAIVFVWDGTPSQVAVGFFVTFACTVLSLILQPFNGKLRCEVHQAVAGLGRH
eukprot:950984-Rhodomonas_salina.1